MEFLIPSDELLPFILALTVSGLVAGYLAGAFGIGSGAVLVPVFYQMFTQLGIDDAVRMHLCVGTSLAIIVPTSIRSYLSHLKRGNVDQDLLKSWVIVVPLGVVLASLISIFISGAGLRTIFVVVAVIVGIKLLFARESWRLGDDIPANPGRSIAGAGIGFISTFMGIGGGVMNNTFMSLYGRPLHQAVSTSSGLGVLISVPGTIGYIIAGYLANIEAGVLPIFSVGYINLLAVIFIIPLTVIAVPFGVRSAHALSKRQLEIAFGLFMFVVAARFAYSLLG